MLATQSCRGTIRDTNNSNPRRFVVPIIYFVIIFNWLEFLLLVLTIVLVGYDNNFSFDFNEKHIVESIRDATECMTEVDQEAKSVSVRKKNGVVFVILFVQMILLLADVLIKTLYYTELLMWLAKFFKNCMKVVCCCCRGKMRLLEEVGELMEAVFHKDSFPITDGIAGLCYLYSKTECRDQGNQLHFKGETGKYLSLIHI